MRINADPSSPEYWRLQFRKSPLITLDGEIVRGCTIADSDDGWVQCARYDADGRLVVIGSEVVEDRRSGKVHIVGERC